MNESYIDSESDLETSISDFNIFVNDYSKAHGYVSCTICIVGLVSNILSLLVLTRKHMIKSTNCILIALAIADTMTMSFYLVFAVYFYIVTEPFWYYMHSEGWMYVVVFSNFCVITCRNVSMSFTVYLAVFRYVFVCHNEHGNRRWSIRKVTLTLFIVGMATVMTSAPIFFLNQVVELPNFLSNDSFAGYWMTDSEFVLKHPYYSVLVMWLNAIVLKLLPCIVLTILSSLICIHMYQGKQSRQRLQTCNSRLTNEHSRTTKMLLSVVLLFVVSEFPQAVLLMISGLDVSFFQNVYVAIGDLLDLLVLLNAAVNFILYCTMNKQFRDTFKQLFVCQLLRRIHGPG